jgi:hypothetical protein
MRVRGMAEILCACTPIQDAKAAGMGKTRCGRVSEIGLAPCTCSIPERFRRVPAVIRALGPFRLCERDHGDFGRANAGAARAPAPRTSRLTTEVSEDVLRAIAKRGYEAPQAPQHAHAIGPVPRGCTSGNLAA